MGTINYKTSDYITIGYNLDGVVHSGEEHDDFLFWIEEDCKQIESILEKQCFNYFSINIEPGYYEGFSIDIKNNFDFLWFENSYCFNDYNEKQRALKEATGLKALLLELVNNFGLCVVYPGWCTGYSDYKTTLKEINAATKEMKAEIKAIPTWRTLQVKGA